MRPTRLSCLGACTLILQGAQLAPSVNPDASTLAQRVAKQYSLTSSPGTVVDELAQITNKPGPKAAHQLVYDLSVRHCTPERCKQTVLYQIFSRSSAYAAYAQQLAPIINAQAAEELQLLHGDERAPHLHVLARIDRTHTHIGRSLLATWLLSPTTNIARLQRRQACIKHLVQHITHHDTLQQYLNVYRTIEPSVISFWTIDDPLYSKTYVNYMESTFYFKKESARNFQAGQLEWNKRLWRDFFHIQLPVISPLVVVGVASLINLPSRSIALHRVSDAYGQVSRLDRYLINHAYLTETFYTLPGIGIILQQQHNALLTKHRPGEKLGSMWSVGLTSVLSTALWAWQLIGAWKSYKSYRTALRNLAMRMADVQQLVCVLQHIDSYVQQSPELAKQYGPQLVHTRALLQQVGQKTELGRLMTYLITLNLHHWRYFRDPAGKLLALYKLFCKHKNQFINAMYELGQMDVYSSTAQLIRETQTLKNTCRYSFPTYLTRKAQPRPYINVKGLWHVLLSPQKAVSNDLHLGHGPKLARNLVITGPNAGGKSTFLIASMQTLLLGQTLGIVNAKQATFTPFDKLSTYLQAKDDLYSGKSRFMMEVERAQAEIDQIKALQKGALSFSIKDELFSGTNPIEGEAAAYSVLRYAGRYQNALSIVATHFPRLTLLEKQCPKGSFHNYKVYIKRVKNAKTGQKHVQYIYKVVRGRANQTTALDLLLEQGYDAKALYWARDMVAHPERYKT